jgi:hypothetical protein
VRQVVRHKAFAVAEWASTRPSSTWRRWTRDFHLFTELGSGQDSVVHRGGPTGWRVAQVEPHPEASAPHAVEVTVVFNVDSERGRGALLYHRYDGRYGLITPPTAADAG